MEPSRWAKVEPYQHLALQRLCPVAIGCEVISSRYRFLIGVFSNDLRLYINGPGSTTGAPLLAS